MAVTVLPPAAEKVLKKFDKVAWLKNFYLAGGTALALQYNHRQSVDLDWFSKKSINTAELIKQISKVGSFTLIKEEKNTVEGVLDKVKVSFMTYPYPLLEKAISYLDTIKLAAPKDIAVMKLQAIAGRNTKKDFIDLYIYLHHEKYSLSEVFGFVTQKFKGMEYDFYHLRKSLVYFADADTEPMPRMIEKVDWKKIKKFFVREVKMLD